jgi:thioester reductase-like protein
MAAPPIILEQMISYLQEHNDFSAVQRLKFILFGGAPLKREAGEWFQAHNVNVRNAYGSTEMNVTMCADLDPKSKSWNSLRPIWNFSSEPYIVLENTDDGLKHLYLTSNSPAIALGVSNRPDGGFDSNDLFKEDPEAPGYYIYMGRRDDTLIMENGEKTNPVPMEAAIRQSPMVKQVAVLGHGYQCTSALIEIDLEYAINYGPEEIITAVHEAVEDANKECPSHSTILPQMVKILPFSKSLPSTDKGTVMRKKAEAMYKDIVEKLYKDFLEGPNHTLETDSSSWTPEQTESFLVKSAAEVLRLSESVFNDHSKSVFDLGLNSLTAIQLRNAIAKSFSNVPQNFLFQHPTISSMREALLSENHVDPAQVIETRYQQTQELAQAYVERAKDDFPVAKNEYEIEKKEKVVMLSGATGSLGAFILRDLLKDASVRKVYCLVRGKESDLYSRLVKAFESRHLDSSLLKSDRVEALPMRLNEPYLGFTKERYEQLKEEVTIVQHCAWLLDFNMTIDHYDKECIAPFYNLLKFAYRQVNPMHVHFISSVSASAGLGSEIEEKPLPFNSRVAMPMGYAHSKFVCEILLNYLTKEKNFPCYVERVGQVCGDSENGVWNTSEQFPLMFIAGGSLMHKMPKLDTDVDWVSVDYAAATIVAIMISSSQLSADEDNSIYHIVNPHVITWEDVLTAMRSNGMKFDTVDPAEWVNVLSKDDTNPAYRLMSFYEDSFKNEFKMPIWQTKKTCDTAPILGQSPTVDPILFKKYLSHWQSVGFYNPNN